MERNALNARPVFPLSLIRRLDEFFSKATKEHRWVKMILDKARCSVEAR